MSSWFGGHKMLDIEIELIDWRVQISFDGKAWVFLSQDPTLIIGAKFIRIYTDTKPK